MSHKHHIIPKHIGGTDDPSNLIELSVEDHAEAHRLLYEEHGRWQDYNAWQGLAKLAPKEELVRYRQSQAGKLRQKMYPNPCTGIKTGKNFALYPDHQKEMQDLANSKDSIEKKKKTFTKNKHQQGERNSQFGTRWCVEEDAKDLTAKKKFREIPEGWITTPEWKERRKDKTNNAYGRHWYNDGSKNFYLKESDLLAKQLTKGRLMVVN